MTPIRGRYVRLPPDDVLVDLWRVNGENGKRVAAILGCSESAVGKRLAKLGVERTVTIRRPRIRLGSRIDELEQRVHDLERAVAVLATAPAPAREVVRLVQWKPDHTRHVDGGIPIRQQRKRVRAEVAAALEGG